MMTALEHSDHILKAKAGETITVCRPVQAVNMHEGGRIFYAPGDRLRVKHSLCDLLWCLDDEARTVSFDRPEMIALQRTVTTAEESL